LKSKYKVPGTYQRTFVYKSKQGKTERRAKVDHIVYDTYSNPNTVPNFDLADFFPEAKVLQRPAAPKVTPIETPVNGKAIDRSFVDSDGNTYYLEAVTGRYYYMEPDETGNTLEKVYIEEFPDEDLPPEVQALKNPSRVFTQPAPKEVAPAGPSPMMPPTDMMGFMWWSFQQSQQANEREQQRSNKMFEMMMQMQSESFNRTLAVMQAMNQSKPSGGLDLEGISHLIETTVNLANGNPAGGADGMSGLITQLAPLALELISKGVPKEQAVQQVLSSVPQQLPQGQPVKEIEAPKQRKPRKSKKKKEEAKE
ncbi:MAG: hypothetical protein KGJ90_02410, partial [Patescibacteria group bacterium]|nr:hypothetical protein [Patescibacteria group bacterium]